MVLYETFEKVKEIKIFNAYVYTCSIAVIAYDPQLAVFTTISDLNVTAVC